MRYWIYKDSQILGPLAKEELGLAGGLRPETLVCAENSAGRMDTDWRCAEEVPELSGFYAGAPARLGDDALLEPGFGVMERLQLENLPFSGEEDWLAGIFASESRITATEGSRPDEPARKEAPSVEGGLSPVLEEAVRQDLLIERSRVKELAEQIELLRRRLAEIEGPKAPESRSGPEQPSPRVPGPKPETSSQPGGGEPLPRLVKIAPAKSLHAARKEAPSLEGGRFPLPEGAARKEAPSLSGGPAPVLDAPPQLPEEGSALPGREAPPSLELTAPPAAAQPALTMPPLFAADIQPVFPQPAEPKPAAASATLEAAPMSAPGAGMPTPAVLPPLTMAYSAAGLPAAVPFTQAAGEMPLETGVEPAAAGKLAGMPTTQEVLAQLAQPQRAKTATPAKPKGRQRTFLIVIGVAAAGLVGAGWFFFHDAKDIKTAVSMDSGRRPVGGEVSDEGLLAPGTRPAPQAAPQPKPADQTAAPQAQPQAAAPAPAAPVAAAEAIRDERPAAIDLVKNFPLDGDRGTIGAWLQYSFAASPGEESTEKWDAGAVEESTYLVQYAVQPSGQKIREAITYLFEADVARKTVRGKNPAAQKLLAGGARPKAKPVKPKKKAVRKRAAPTPPKEVPLLPLPSDSDLVPPAGDDSAFRSDTVQPNL